MRYLYTICAIVLMGYINNANATYDPFKDPQYQKPWMDNVFGMHADNGYATKDPQITERPTECIADENDLTHRAAYVGSGTDSPNFNSAVQKFVNNGQKRILFFKTSSTDRTIYAAYCNAQDTSLGEINISIGDTVHHWRLGDTSVKYDGGRIEKAMCPVNSVIRAYLTQPHLDPNVHAHSKWQCVCEWEGSFPRRECSWKPVKPETRCEINAGYIYVPEKGGTPPKAWLQLSPKAFLQCGQSFDETTHSVKTELNSGITWNNKHKLGYTYTDTPCPNNAEYATLIPQTHLNDNVGGQKWRCECVGDDCAWKRVGTIPTCTVQNSSYKNIEADIAGTSNGIRVKKFNGYDDNQINKFLAGPTNGTPILMNASDQTSRQGYKYYIGSYGALSDNICVSKTCRTENGDRNHRPDENYENCIKQRPCQIGSGANLSRVSIGHKVPHYCFQQSYGSIPRVTSTDPTYHIVTNNVSHDVEDGCEYLCTTSGWAVRLSPRNVPCNNGYIVAQNMHECISDFEVRKRFCEKSGGTFNRSYHSGSVVYNCDAPNERYPYNTVSYRGSVYIYYDICNNSDELYHPRRGCKKKNRIPEEEINQYFDATKPAEELEKIMQGMQTWNGTSGTESTSVAAADSTAANTDTISTLAGRLALVEDQFGLSKWRTADGKFNTARLASDLTAGVVLGTTGALVTSSVVKKKQVKDGFESLECTVGGQHVGAWGDVFRIDGK